VSLRFTVEDSGIGIASNKFASIFESFTQASNDTTRVYGGTGLGLTIVKKLVELQKGEISVSSQLNEGAVFNVVLPFKKGDKDASKRDTNAYVQPDEYPKNLKVLMAEDNELNQLLSKSMFARLGLELDIAENGKVAWEKVQRTEYDVILMDVQMPEMDGYQTTQKIRHELPKPLSEIPIIAITAHSLPSELKKCLDAGMNGYVSKPFKINELTAKITALMNEGKSSMKTI
jgi:CheY-like chemotaxis protein